jgi:hypothetical protein
VVASVLEGIDRLRPGWALRPLSVVYWRAFPEPILDREIGKIAAVVAAGVCDDTVAKAEKTLRDGALWRVTIGVGSKGSDYLRANVNLRPRGCDHDINCEFTFRGHFTKARIYAGDAVTVVGRLDKITAPEPRRKVYIDFEDCYAESTQ